GDQWPVEKHFSSLATGHRPPATLIQIERAYAHVRRRAREASRAVSIGTRTSPQRRLASGRRVALWRLGNQPALCAGPGAVLRGAKQLLADPGDERADPRGRLGVYPDLPDLPGWRGRLHRGEAQEPDACGD